MTILMPLCAACLFGIAAQSLKRRPVDVALSAACANALITSAFVVLAIRSGFVWDDVNLVDAAVMGTLLFVGQHFSMKAVTHGDPGVAASVLGVKIPLIPMIAWLAYDEAPGSGVAVGALVAAVGVFLLNSRARIEQTSRPLRYTIGTACCAAFSFAVFDLMVAHIGQDSIATLATGMVLSLVVSTADLIRARANLSNAKPWSVLTGAGVMGASMLVFVLSVWLTSAAAQCNIVFATRGIATMFAGAVIDRKLSGAAYSRRQMIGAVGIILAAIATYAL